MNHDTLLHRHSDLGKSSTSRQPFTSSQVQPPTEEVTSLSCHASTSRDGQIVLLDTVKVLIADACGHYHSARAILDSGSQISAIKVALTKRLGLHVHRSPFQVIGISSGATNVQGATSSRLTSRYDRRVVISFTPVIFPSIVKNYELPTIPLPHLRRKYGHLCLADEDFTSPTPFNLLLGANVYPFVYNSSEHSVLLGKPSAIKTIFEYVILGTVDSSTTASPHVSLFSVTAPLETIVQKFWESEEFSVAPILNEEDEYAETHFQQHCRRDDSGRYAVAIPFKPHSNLNCLRNRRMAE